MPIDNPEAVRFTNEVVRPMCEKIRALKAEIDAVRVVYDASIGTHFFSFGGESIVDKREAEGVSRLTGNDILGYVDVVLYQMKALLDTVGVGAMIAKPCVRPFKVQE